CGHALPDDQHASCNATTGALGRGPRRARPAAVCILRTASSPERPSRLVRRKRTAHERKPGNFVYLSATLDAATWGAELAVGEGRGRIYIVEPTGSIEDDPNLTNKRFPGNPTKSYR